MADTGPLCPDCRHPLHGANQCDRDNCGQSEIIYPKYLEAQLTHDAAGRTVMRGTEYGGRVPAKRCAI